MNGASVMLRGGTEDGTCDEGAARERHVTNMTVVKPLLSVRYEHPTVRIEMVQMCGLARRRERRRGK